MDGYSWFDYELAVKLYAVSKCQFLTRPHVLTVLLECIEFLILNGNIKQAFGKGYLPYYILNIAIVAN